MSNLGISNFGISNAPVTGLLVFALGAVVASTMIGVLKTLVCCAKPLSASLLIPRLYAEH
jgi:hypothetical protein